MEKEQVNILISEKNTEEVINQLLEEVKYDYDEYTMLKLAETYQNIGNIKEAKKLIKKMLRLFPSGDYAEQTEKLKDLLEGKTENKTKSIDNNDTDVNISGTGMLKEDNSEESAKIPDSIHEYFKDNVGLESVENELEGLYNLLCLQNDRKNNDFQPDLINNLHFAIVGNRGCGKTMVGNIICKLLYSFGMLSNTDTVLIQGRDIARSFNAEGDKGIIKLFSVISNKSVIVENYEDILKEYDDINLRAIALCLENIMKEHSLVNAVIITGNNESIQQLLAVDETFQDTLYSIIKIQPYSPENLVIIAEKLARERALSIQKRTKDSLLRAIEREYKNEEFMNAITLKRYIDEATSRMAKRYKVLKQSENTVVSDKDLVCLLPEDFGFSEIAEDTLEKLLEELDSLTGLSSIKTQIKKQVDFIKVANKAREAGSDRKISAGAKHMLFIGNPGTGKTTVAKLIGKIYHNLGVLSKGDTVMCTRSDLVAEYVGSTAPQVRQKVKEAMGGVLFIDEAYSMVQNENDSFGKEAVDELIVQMENNRDNFVVILAGYPEKMKEFLKSNPGFKSRIRNEIIFEDYNVEEMVDIFKCMVKNDNMQLENGIDELLHNFIQSKSKAKDFGNARGVRNVYEDVIDLLNERLEKTGLNNKLNKKQYNTILATDLENVLENKTSVRKSLDDLLNELNGLIGLESVKKKVNEIVRSVQVSEYAKNNGIDITDEKGTLHLVFKGNAGTGKTSVARLLGQIYKELGVLKKDVFIETGRKDLVGRYLGHTAKQVENIIKEADGGVLFIDEAYSLVQGEHDEFGQEAIDALVAELENKRDSLMVIVAGYSDKMDMFLDANQGLSSRLSNEIYFEDYTIDELQKIFNYMVSDRKLLLQNGLEETIKELIQKEKEATKDFGNARGVRNFIERVITRKNVRLASALDAGEKPSEEEFKTLIKEDFITE